MSIALCDIYCLCFLKNSKNKNRYLILKNYIDLKIDIKEMLRKNNELEKLKIFTLSEEDKKLFHATPNILPEDKKCTSIWESFDLEKLKKINSFENKIRNYHS
jgi:hypothetical protein